MKCSDFIAEYLKSIGVDTVFGYQGSSISHTIDSISRMEGVEFIESRHEQGASFEAVGYSLVRDSVGVAVACSGPGALNLITGIADAWYDSVPVIFIVGQVSTKELRVDKKQRQFGFQETEVVSMVSSITKYAVSISDVSDIAYELEKAVWYAQEGRKGPVLIELPHNIQGASIDNPDRLDHFIPPVEENLYNSEQIKEVLNRWYQSPCPLLLIGGGFPDKEKQKIKDFCQNNSIPVVSSYMGKDKFDNTTDNYLGVIGAYGNRAANLAVKYCRQLLVIGSRLDGRQTGGDWSMFAPEADIVAVDIDAHELNKDERVAAIHADAKDVLFELYKIEADIDHDKWLRNLNEVKNRYPVSDEYIQKDGINPNYFIEQLSLRAGSNSIFTVDVGQNQIWFNTSARLKESAKAVQSCGLGSMGFALPAAIGAWYAKKGDIYCISGDGGFQMNLQELQVISYNRIPIKIFVFNNHSLGLIRVYQNKALGSRHIGSVEQFGSPELKKISEAYGLKYYKISSNSDLTILDEIIAESDAVLVEVEISSASESYPEPTYLKPVYHQSLELSDKEIAEIEELLK